MAKSVKFPSKPARSASSSQAAMLAEKISKLPFEKVKVAVTDIDGILRGKYLAREKFLSAIDGGFGFCNVVLGWDSSDVCYDNIGFTGWHSGYPDAMVRLDPRTYRQIPWEGGLPFVLGDFEGGGGKGLEICPRSLLRKIIARAAGEGFDANFGMEFEWFNFRETPQSIASKKYVSPEPITPGMFGYSVLRTTQSQPYFAALMDETRAFRVPVEGLHTETGPGVFEAAILYSDALEAADRAVLFKSSAKEIGSRFGIMPSFMAKWNAKLPGCSGHMHQSLWRDGKNLFDDARRPHRMSALFESYVAGQLLLLPEILPLFAPTVNSYKRLVDGYWAPTKVSWGVDNRTVAARVIPSASGKATRLETRVPGSDVNPYLGIAAALASGLHGVQKGLKLRHAATQGSAYTNEKAERLPRNLWEATQRFKNSKLVREILGDAFVDHFAATREWEWRQFQDSVTSWEMERYFEII